MMADAEELRPDVDGGGRIDPSAIHDPIVRPVTDNSTASNAAFSKPSPKVDSAARSSARNPWANMPQYPTADPWQATSYLISGVLLWGLLGYGAARWLGIPILTGVGMITGGVLGIVLTYIRYGRPQSGASASMPSAAPDLDPPDLPRASAPSRSQSVQRPPTPPPPSDNTAEEEKP